MKGLPRSLGLGWKVYKNYYFKEKDGKTYITTDFSKDDIKKTYYPNKKEERCLFIEFAEAEPDKENVLRLVNKYGLLKTLEKYNGNGVNKKFKGDLLEEVYEEIKALKKAWKVYKSLTDKWFFTKLKENIKFKEVGTERNTYSKSIRIKKQIIVEPILKSDPLTYIVLNQSEKIDEVDYQLNAMRYLLDTISKRIMINGGAIPSYFVVHLTDADTDEILKCTFVPNLDCNNLAAALWIQFYNFISEGPYLVKCKNERCDNVFIKEGKQKYCRKQCRVAKNMRDYRRRKKEKF